MINFFKLRKKKQKLLWFYKMYLAHSSLLFSCNYLLTYKYEKKRRSQIVKSELQSYSQALSCNSLVLFFTRCSFVEPRTPNSLLISLSTLLLLLQYFTITTLFFYHRPLVSLSIPSNLSLCANWNSDCTAVHYALLRRQIRA